MEQKEILELIQVVSDSSLSAFHYEEKGVKISLKKEVVAVQENKSVLQQTLPAAAVPEALVPGKKENGQGDDVGKKPGNLIESPLVGTFYAAPSEDAEAFVKAGDTVKKGQVLAIVEAMKLMNEIESEYDGVVEEILVENNQMVEYGQPLFRIV